MVKNVLWRGVGITIPRVGCLGFPHITLTSFTILGTMHRRERVGVEVPNTNTAPSCCLNLPAKVRYVKWVAGKATND